jgi:Replication-relaxation
MRRDLALSIPAAVALELIYHHRLLSTPQVHEILAGPYTERSVVRLLDQLRDRELVASLHVRRPGGRQGHRLWFLTQLGAEVVEAAPGRAETRRRLLTPALAAGQLQAHTLAVNDVGLAFMRAARVRGDDFGPYSWRHEVAHDLGRRLGKGRGQVIADAVLRYWMPLADGRIAVRYRFVELDRANRLVDDVAGKLARYAELREVWDERPRTGREAGDEAPAWPTLYRHFPVIVVVLANAARANLQRRLSNLFALCRADPEGSPDGVSVYFVFFEDLRARGPFAPIFRRREAERPVNWLGQ